MKIKTATPAGVYVYGNDGGEYWVWRDTIARQLKFVGTHGGQAQLATGVVGNHEQLTNAWQQIQDASREAWKSGAYRDMR